MSVRRLADEGLQPQEFAFSEANVAWARDTIAKYPEGRQQSAVIPLLMRAQDQEGWVTRASIEAIANMLDMPYIRVLEVATFYTQFQLKPVGTHAHIQVCGTTPCMLRGAEDLRGVCERRINAEPFETNADGTLSWEEVECLGACVNAPMVMIGPDTYEDLSVERFEEIVTAFAEGKGETVTPGPQNGRNHSEPINGRTTLLEESGPHGHESGGTPAREPEATTPGRKRAIEEEAAPGIEGPDDAAKVSESSAEEAQEKAQGDASRTPDQAGREGATGSESPAIEDTAHAHGEAMFSRPDGPADDLKLIGGVGPAIEKKLHGLGITQYHQVAGLTEAQIEKVDAALNFKGRVARDNWTGQAKALADGGEAEYERVFGKKPR